MYSLPVYVAVFLAGQFLWASAVPTILCNTNKTISITVLSTDTDYLNKTIRLVDGVCVGTAGPVASTGGTYVIPSCTGVNTIDWDTEYQFLFQEDSRYWTSTDKLLTLSCVADTADQTLNATIGVTVPTTDATVTGTVTPAVTLTIEKSGSSTTTAVVGDSLDLSVDVGSDYTSDFTILLKQVTITSGSTTLSVLDGTSGCVNSDGSQIGFSNPVDATGGSKTSLTVSFSAFLLTLDAASAVSNTGSTLTFSATVGVCFDSNAACDIQNCTDGSSANGRRKREVTDENVAETELTKSLMVFPTDQSEDDFLASVLEQYGNQNANTGSDNQVCVDRTSSFSIIAVLVALIVVSCIVVTCLLFRTRRSNEKTDSEAGFANRAYRQ